MDSEMPTDSSTDAVAPDTFPETVAEGTTVLLCNFDPTTAAVGLSCLARFGVAEDTAVVVTTSQGVEATVDAYRDCGEANVLPTLGVVDTVSEGQSISATYNDVPTVFTPSGGDTERLVLALSELTAQTPPAGERHLLVRSLSPMLDAVGPAQVTDVLERITGLRTTEGMALFGLDYTAHDESTVTAVARTADRVLWVTRDPDGDCTMELRSARSDFGRLSGV